MKKIYVAHPLRGADGLPETIAANRAAADELLRNLVAIYEGREVLFFSPIHVFSYFPADGDQAEVLERCGELLLLCDELWVFGEWKASQGCRYEVALAEECEMPIRFHGMGP